MRSGRVKHTNTGIPERISAARKKLVEVRERSATAEKKE
jgi:hypothetical protein